MKKRQGKKTNTKSGKFLQKRKGMSNNRAIIKCLFKKEYLFMGMILLVATYLRLTYLQQIIKTDNYFFNPHEGDDTHMYVTASKQILDGSFPKSPFGYNPLYYYFLALCYVIFGYNLYFPRLIQVILGVVNCIVGYLIGKQVFNQWVGVIAALLCSICGTLIFHEGVLLSTALTTTFSLVSLYFFIYAKEKNSKRGIILGGIFLGLATLSQPNVIIILPFVLLWMFVAMWKEWRNRLIPFTLILITSFFLTLSPVTIRNYIYSGKFILLTQAGGFQFWLGNNEHADGKFNFCQPYLDRLQEKMQQEKRDLYVEEVINFARSNPWKFIKLQIKKFFLFWGYWDIPHQINYEISKQDTLLRYPFITTFGEIAIVGLTGIILSLRQWRKFLLLYFFIFGYSFSVIAFLVVGRYRPPVIPVLSIFSGMTLYYFYTWLRGQSYSKILLSLIPFSVFLGVVNYESIPWLGIKEQPVEEIKTLGQAKDKIIFKDCSDEWHGGKCAQLNSPDIFLKKEFLIDNVDVNNIKEGTIIFKLGGGKVGSAIIKMNDRLLTKVACKDFFIPGGVPAEGLLGSVRICPIPPDYFKTRVNTIILQVIEGGAVAMPIDNSYNYSRSFLSTNAGVNWQKVEGEYMMELEIKLKGGVSK